MSTWIDDITDPKLKEAWLTVGNQSTDTLKAMVKALSFASFLNTPEDEKRLKAAKYILKQKRKSR